jgi:thymidylate kinase
MEKFPIPSIPNACALSFLPSQNKPELLNLVPQTPEQEEVSQFVTAVFRAWQQAGIAFLVLRNYENLPQSISNDIDILLNPSQRRAAEDSLLATAGNSGFRLHNRAEFATLALYFSSKRSNAQVHFDLFTALKWRSFDFLRCDEFLERRINRNLFSIPHSADEAATNLLANMIYTGKVKEKYKPSITTGFRNEPAAATTLLAKAYGPELAEFVVANGAKENWSQLEAATPALRRALITRQLIGRPFATLASFVKDGARLFKRILHPPGLTVVLCGADGSGKSTVARAIIEGLSPSFSTLKGRQFHWKPPVFSGKRMAARSPTDAPHAKPLRNTIVSLIYFAFHLFEFVLGSRLRIRPVIFRGGLVLIDRYYYDFFVDQRRYRLKVPLFLVRLGCQLIKKPDLVLLLDAPAEVLQQRKQEVPLAETQRQREAYLSLMQRFPNAKVVNAAEPVDKVASDCIKLILDFMAARALHRQ